MKGPSAGRRRYRKALESADELKAPAITTPWRIATNQKSGLRVISRRDSRAARNNAQITKPTRKLAIPSAASSTKGVFDRLPFLSVEAGHVAQRRDAFLYFPARVGNASGH